MSKAAIIKNNDRTLGWASIILPFTFLVPAGLYYLHVGIPYDGLFGTSMLLSVMAPVAGLIVGFLVRKTGLGKAGIVINIIWILYNLAWIAALPRAILYSKF